VKYCKHIGAFKVKKKSVIATLDPEENPIQSRSDEEGWSKSGIYFHPGTYKPLLLLPIFENRF
jgi:hypothetical protein